MVFAGILCLLWVNGPAKTLNSHSKPIGISAKSAFRLKAALWLDARTEQNYNTWHIPGALRLTEPEWDTLSSDFFTHWHPGMAVVVYCDGGGCATSRHIAGRLASDLGNASVYWVIGGTDALNPKGGT